MKRIFGNFAVFIGVMSAFPYANASIISKDALDIALGLKQNKLKPGSNITIAADGTISAKDTIYTLPTATKTVKGGVIIGDNITVDNTGKISAPAPVTPGNGTVTIKQGGVQKGTFTMNQTGATTIELTDADTKYTLPKATATTLGGVIIGDNITVDNTGKISAPAPVTPGNGTVTIKQGGVQKGTFTMNQAGATTIELTDNNTTYTATGTNGVSASVSGGNISVSGTSATRDVVGVAKLGVIPVGTTGTGTATIWVE